MTHNKIRIRNRVSTGKICPSCQGIKEDRAKVCKTCHDIEVSAQVNAPIKTCVDCGLDYPNKEMYYTRCITCSKINKKLYSQTETEKERNSIRNKEWRKNNPDKARESDIIRRCRKAGFLSQAKYIIQLSKTQTHCLICKRHKDICGVLNVDHNHETGKFRGLICGNCNIMLGHSKDNIDTLLEAIEYLKKHHS